MPFQVVTSGSFKATRDFARRMTSGELYNDLDRWGREGVEALRKATPVNTGLSADSWTYRVIRGKKPTVAWYNTNDANGTPVVILIQYGHATGTGGWVAGRDFINPAIQPLFDRISGDMWKKVKNG